MRTTQLRIGSVRTEAILVAGGPGFKIYTASGTDGWIISARKRIIVVKEGSPDFKTVGRYVNLRFQPMNEQPAIKKEFDSFLKASIEPPPIAPHPPDLQP